jgi:hypothetical protein
MSYRLLNMKWPQNCKRESKSLLMRITLLTTFLVVSFIASSQSFHLGLFGGVSNYQGDLVDKYYSSRFTRPAFGITGTYELSDRLNVRAGFTTGKILGYDRYNTKTYLQERNLSFESNISEFSLLGEFNVFNLYNIRWTPYFFGGLAVFRFNPYAFDENGEKVFLKPLSTEGQGLDGYDTKPYSLTQFALPAGFGIKYAFDDRVRLGFEVGLRKTFTDHLDDVSTNYADPNDLLAARGPQAVALSYRGDEHPNGSLVYPDKGAQRGGATQQDIYYFTGFHISFRLGGGEGIGKKRYGCPVVKP